MKRLALKKWRRIYRYICAECQKQRYTFKLERKKLSLCHSCERDHPNENQILLFGDEKTTPPECEMADLSRDDLVDESAVSIASKSP